MLDRLAVDEKCVMYLASVICPGMAYKRLRALLSQERDAEFRHDGIGVRRDGEDRVGTPKQLIRAPDGYVQYAHNLDYGHVHALFVAKTRLAARVDRGPLVGGTLGHAVHDPDPAGLAPVPAGRTRRQEPR